MISGSNPIGRLQCDHPGCNRSYLRAEHLNRHRLTHQSGAFQCCLCSKHFTRKYGYSYLKWMRSEYNIGGYAADGISDLLRAHLKRHEKRPGRNGPPIQGRRTSTVVESGQQGPLEQIIDQSILMDETPPHRDVPREQQDLGMLPTGTVWQDAFATDHPNLQPLDFHWPFQDGGIFGLPSHDYLNTLGASYIDPLRDDYSIDHSHGSLDEAQQTDFIGPEVRSDSNFNSEIDFAREQHQNIVADYPDLRSTIFSNLSKFVQLLDRGLDYADTCMPYFHRPTSSVSSLPSMSILALCSLGALLDRESEAQELGRRLHKLVRAQIFPALLESPRVDVATLQTMLVIEHAGLYALSRAEHEMADVFHSMIVTAARRSSLLAKSFEINSSTRESVSKRWKDWIERETIIRLAYTIFIHDVDCSMHFMHPMILAPGMLKLPLPCPPDLWQAGTAEEWDQLNEKGRHPSRSTYVRSLEAALEALLDNSQYRRRGMLQSFSASCFTMQILIHGLASVVFEHKFRAIGQRSNPGIHSLEAKTLETGLSCWYQCFENMKPDSSSVEMSRAALITYHFVSILLYESLSDMQMAAGMAYSWGRAVTPQRAQEAFLPLVTTSPVGEEAYRHALQIISLCLDDHDTQSHVATEAIDGMQRLAEAQNRRLHPLWITYAAFIAVIVLWAYTIGLSRADSAQKHIQSKVTVWHVEGDRLKKVDIGHISRQEDMGYVIRVDNSTGLDNTDDLEITNVLQRGLSREQRNPDLIEKLKMDVRHLMEVVRKRLGSPSWEISHEAAQVLEGLLVKNGFMD